MEGPTRGHIKAPERPLIPRGSGQPRRPPLRQDTRFRGREGHGTSELAPLLNIPGGVGLANHPPAAGPYPVGPHRPSLSAPFLPGRSAAGRPRDGLQRHPWSRRCRFRDHKARAGSPPCCRPDRRTRARLGRSASPAQNSGRQRSTSKGIRKDFAWFSRRFPLCCSQ